MCSKRLEIDLPKDATVEIRHVTESRVTGFSILFSKLKTPTQTISRILWLES